MESGHFTEHFVKLQKLSQIFQRYFTPFRPKQCRLCNMSYQGQNHSEHLLCETCFSDLELLPLGFDLQLDAPNVAQDLICNQIDGITAASTYLSPISQLITQLKFNQQKHLAKLFGYLIEQQLSQLTWPKFDYICPLPLHRHRFVTRGFNQAELISRFIQPKHYDSVFTGLKRVKPTQAQSELARRERLLNIKHAFDCERNLAGTKILIIDDVITTGATVNEAAKELKRCGANSVFIAVTAISTNKTIC